MKFETLKRSHVKRNIMIGVIVVLIISAVVLNFTQAKYRTTQSIPLINGTIHYNSGDLNVVAIYIKDDDDYTQTDTIPESGYVFDEEKSYCEISNSGETIKDENTILTYDGNGVTISNITKRGTKCYLYFNKYIGDPFNDVLEEAYDNNQTMFAYDSFNNLRYIGTNPYNYVYFNCDDYFNSSDNTCELWRIIGIFSEDSHGVSGEKLVKIVRNESIGSFEWDSGSVNNWQTSSLQTQLNNYLNGNILEDSKGINSQTRFMMETVVWKLGANIENVNASSSYYYERGTNVYSGRPTSWSGKMALIYPSDYAYATSGGSSMSRDICIMNALSSWSSNNYKDCRSNNWLYNGSRWTLTPTSTNSFGVYAITSVGGVYASSAQEIYDIYPSVYLTSNVSVTGGNGSKNSPYTLAM